MPCHNSTTRPARATKTRKRVLVRKWTTALDGGNRALADFHVTPPLGSSIVQWRVDSTRSQLVQADDWAVVKASPSRHGRSGEGRWVVAGGGRARRTEEIVACNRGG